MTRLRSLAALALTLALAVSAPLEAHEAAKGRNGGLRVDAGKYHTELLVDGSTSVVVFLSDVDDKPIPAAGFKGTAILIIDGKSQRIELVPAEASKLVGTTTPRKLMVAAPDGESVYVVNYESATMSKLAASDLKVLQTVTTLSHPIGITVDPLSGTVWVACYGGAIQLFDEV